MSNRALESSEQDKHSAAASALATRRPQKHQSPYQVRSNWEPILIDAALLRIALTEVRSLEPVRIGVPDPHSGNVLLEQFAGADNELPAACSTQFRI